MKFLTETWLVYQRSMTRTFRSFRGVVVMTVQPLFFLLLFAPLLKSSLRGADPDNRAGTVSRA